LPWRNIPGYGVVKDPPPEESKDEPWNCRYCGWQPLCADLPASKVPVVLIDKATSTHPDTEEF
jgi:hypothetical protein